MCSGIPKLTKEQACRLLLQKHGLLGKTRFAGKEGILAFVRQAGCIQFDPVDVCGKNAELVLQSRVKGFTKQMLYELLYEERALVDYFDKNLAIFPMEDWPYFECCREQHRQWEKSHEEIMAVREAVKKEIALRGPLCSGDLDLPDKVNWYWSDTKLSRAALEHLYFAGELAVHHKSGSIKYYDLIENCVPREILEQKNPLADEHSFRKWRVLRRIGAIGFLWNKASDAWLNIDGLKAAERTAIFEELLEEGQTAAFEVEGIKEPFYLQKKDLALLEDCLEKKGGKKRCEFIAPLDNLLWDRKLILALFGFDYKWEIYTPADKRKYGHYVLPILCGERFVGRLQAVNDRKNGVLSVQNIWYEPGVSENKELLQAIHEALERFARLHLCNEIVYQT